MIYVSQSRSSGEEKYHAHVHAVVVMPYIPPKALPAFSEIGLKFGLGRIHIRGKDKSYKRSKDYKSHLASYLSKYITKDNVNGRSSRWGCMMKKIRHAPLADKFSNPPKEGQTD